MANTYITLTYHPDDEIMALSANSMVNFRDSTFKLFINKIDSMMWADKVKVFLIAQPFMDTTDKYTNPACVAARNQNDAVGIFDEIFGCDNATSVCEFDTLQKEFDKGRITN